MQRFASLCWVPPTFGRKMSGLIRYSEAPFPPLGGCLRRPDNRLLPGNPVIARDLGSGGHSMRVLGVTESRNAA